MECSGACHGPGTNDVRAGRWTGTDVVRAGLCFVGGAVPNAIFYVLNEFFLLPFPCVLSSEIYSCTAY